MSTLALDAEALYADLAHKLGPLLQPDTQLLGIASGGVWLAERLHQDLGLGLAQLKWMFLSFQLDGIYQPVTWLSRCADHLLWGTKPFGVHLTSLCLHALNGALLFYLLLRLLELRPGGARGWLRLSAAAGAVFFAAHPLRVEAAAWASQRGLLLAAAFALLSLLAYLEARVPHPEDSVGRSGWLGVSITAFALSLLSHPMAAAGLPVVVLLLDAALPAAEAESPESDGEISVQATSSVPAWPGADQTLYCALKSREPPASAKSTL